MRRAPKQVPAGEFKAHCLALLDEVAATKRELVVTKRGRPVAKLVPVEPRGRAKLAGSIVREDDIVSPTGETWHAERRSPSAIPRIASSSRRLSKRAFHS